MRRATAHRAVATTANKPKGDSIESPFGLPAVPDVDDVAVFDDVVFAFEEEAAGRLDVRFTSRKLHLPEATAGR